MNRKTHRKALRAAQSVVSGTKRIMPTLAGLAFVAYLPACSNSSSNLRVDSKSKTEVVNNNQTSKTAGTAAQSCLQPINMTCSDKIPCQGIDLVCVDGTCQAQDISMVAHTETCSQEDPTCPDGARCINGRCHSVTDAIRAAQECCDAVIRNVRSTDNDRVRYLYNNIAVLGCNPCIMDTNIDCSDTGRCPSTELSCIEGSCWAGEYSQIRTEKDCSDKVPCDGSQSCIEGKCTSQGRDTEPISSCCESHFDVDHYSYAGCTPWGPPAPPVYDGSRLYRAVKA
ncbi:MAG: hypothetical protein CMH54_14560 [Myxococcales bacterium]|nr:hypothetical protein [Myxococcales bacterium]